MSVREAAINAAHAAASDSNPTPPLSPYAEFGLRVAERFGIPTVLLIAGGWWVQTAVVQPLLTAHFDVVGKIVTSQAQQADALDDLGRKLDTLIMVSRDAAKASKTE